MEFTLELIDLDDPNRPEKSAVIHVGIPTSHFQYQAQRPAFRHSEESVRFSRHA
jgi:hypothetical protein